MAAAKRSLGEQLAAANADAAAARQQVSIAAAEHAAVERALRDEVAGLREALSRSNEAHSGALHEVQAAADVAAAEAARLQAALRNQLRVRPVAVVSVSA